MWYENNYVSADLEDIILGMDVEYVGGANKYEVAEKLGLELKEDDDDDD